jgi:spore coat polysaccharide biosynthesis protein SpsF
MKVVIIIQARMTSTRLPGKVLKTILDKSILEHQVERLQRIENAADIVIATTTNLTDQPIVECCQSLSTPYYRGPEADVLARYYGAATEHAADAIVRITSDCPLIDPQVVSEVIRFYVNNFPKYDYVSNVLERTYPRGMDTEVFSYSALQEMFNEATLQQDRENVTTYIYKTHPEKYHTANVFNFEDQSHHRWTVDTPEDFELIKRIIETLYPIKPTFDLADTLKLLNQHPDWCELNAHIEQKKLL